jgi:predicted ester cyclase
MLSLVWAKLRYVGYDPDRPGVQRTREDLRQVVAGLLGQIFPDAHYATEEVIAEGDRVMWRWTFQATHQGPLMGIPPTGKQITFQGVNILRLANGQIVEDRVFRDTMGMMRQLGVLPPPGPPPAQS